MAAEVPSSAQVGFTCTKAKPCAVCGVVLVLNAPVAPVAKLDYSAATYAAGPSEPSRQPGDECAPPPPQKHQLVWAHPACADRVRDLQPAVELRPICKHWQQLALACTT